MTTTYTLAPYLLWIQPKHSQGDIRPLDDVDANGLTMRDLLLQTLTGVLDSPKRMPKKPDVSFTVVDVRAAARCLYFEVALGSSGIESEITGPGQPKPFSRTIKHLESVRYRNLIVLPKGGTHAVLMTERIGNGGVSAFTERLFKDTIQENLDGSLFTQKALMSLADLTALPIMVNSVSFEFPQQRDEDGRLTDLGAAAGKLLLRLKLTNARKLAGFTKGKGQKTRVAPNLIFGVIDEALNQAGIPLKGKALLKSGIKAKVGVELPSGNSRSFTVGEREGPALVYPLGQVASPDDADGPTKKPGEDVLVEAGRDILKDVKGNYGVKSGTPADCVMPKPHDPVKLPETWKAVWREPDHTDSSSS